MFELTLPLRDETETLAFGTRLSTVLTPGRVVFLEGVLGAGKTTCVRGFLRGLDFQGPVKSPTYTLVEEYDFDWGLVYHFDLYRMNDPLELEYIGLREYFTDNAIVFVEWAERGQGVLPVADIEIVFKMEAEGRTAILHANTTQGEQLLLKMKR